MITSSIIKCIFGRMRKIFAQFILLTESHIDNVDRIRYFFGVFLHFYPIAFFINLINDWYIENSQFGFFMCATIVLNFIIGGITHWHSGTFTIKNFILKNLQMILIAIVSYSMLEMLRYTVGENIAGEMVKVTIQVTTLLYPGSKIFKNIFIISKGKYPPEFIMRWLYNFEKRGDLKALFTSKTDDKELEIEFEKYKIDILQEQINEKKEKINNLKNEKNEKVFD